MDDSWRWDGSLESLHSSMTASTRPGSPTPGGDSDSDPDSSDSAPSPPSPSPSPSHAIHAHPYRTPPAIRTRPPSPVSTATAASDPEAPLADARTTTTPLTSILLSDLSPPASPAPSAASFARSPSSRARPPRGRAHHRSATTSSASTTSTDDDELGHGDGGLVMPSLTLRDLDDHHRDEPVVPRVHLVVLGKTADDRRSLAALLAADDYDDDDDQDEDDLAFSFAPTPVTPLCVRIGTCGSSVVLSHPPSDPVDLAELQESLRRPLERFEAKLEPTFPSTESLAAIVSAAGVGTYHAALFLFSSPPLPSEISFARLVSHLVPILPVLVLPPAPTAKPQKTTALSHAVVEQLDSAGVRWLSVESLDRRESRSPPRHGAHKSTTMSSETGGGPLSMLPHDLFVARAPSSRSCSSSSYCCDLVHAPATTEPTSLTSSQELVPPGPLSPTSGPSSSRASSTRSLSPSSVASRRRRRRQRHTSSPASSAAAAARTGGGGGGANVHPLTLLDLDRLRRILDAPGTAQKLARSRAVTFLEWREVEVAARGHEQVGLDALDAAWGEQVVAIEGAERSGGRRGLDFSRRVAERRKLLCQSRDPRRNEEDYERRGDDAPDVKRTEADGEGVDTQDDDGERERRPSLSSTLRDPTTPKPGVPRQHLVAAGGGPSSSRGAPTSTSTSIPSSRSSAWSPSSGSVDSSGGRSRPSPARAARSPAPPPGSYFPPFGPSAPSRSSSPRPTVSPTPTESGSTLVGFHAGDPFHFPSLLHLVGLNLRLAVFHTSTLPDGDVGDHDDERQSDEEEGDDLGDSEADEKELVARSGTLDRHRPSTGDQRKECYHHHHHDDDDDAERRQQQGWWRTLAVVGVVFTAGVVAGIRLVDYLDPAAHR
ncbi:hypothetical protein JCM11491_000643 [Sporobolomyces phaffii]